MKDREDALERWARVARGEGDDELVWLGRVARSVLAADKETKSKRPWALMKAIGLAGNLDKLRQVRELIASMREYENLGAPHRRGESTQLEIAAVREHRLVPENSSEEAVRKLIGRALARKV